MRFFKLTLWMCLSVLLAGGCIEKSDSPVAVADRPIPDFQSELLDTAFELATAIPLAPHIKDRARFQEQAFDAALELDQPARALEYAGQIPNWRQGMAYANYAYYCAELGVTNRVEDYLALADKAARSAEQDWRRERVAVRMAQTWDLLGRKDKADAIGTVLKDSEFAAAELLKNQRFTEGEFDADVAKLDAQIAIGGLDVLRGALSGYTALYEQFYGDADRRVLIEEKITGGWNALPHFDRIDVLKKLAEIALQKGDRESAIRLAEEVAGLIEGSEWPAEYHVPLLAKLATLRIECGQTGTAMADLQNALDVFDGGKKEITDIYRAEALIPVAEAYARAADMAKACETYALAVEESVVNANSRPRAEDLCQVCLSMAKSRTEPTDALWTRIGRLQSELGEPW
jgi:hypothetical protein